MSCLYNIQLPLYRCMIFKKKSKKLGGGSALILQIDCSFHQCNCLHNFQSPISFGGKYIYIYIHTRTYPYICICIHKHSYIYTYIHTYKHITTVEVGSLHTPQPNTFKLSFTPFLTFNPSKKSLSQVSQDHHLILRM